MLNPTVPKAIVLQLLKMHNHVVLLRLLLIKCKRLKTD